MDVLNQNQYGGNLEKEYKRVAKYSNINAELAQEQKNRFIKLFPHGKEKYMFLILRIMNVYAMNIQANVYLFNTNQKYKEDILKLIFSNNYFSKIDSTYPLKCTLTMDYADFMKNFFDWHLERRGDIVIYKCFYNFNSNCQFNHNDYADYVQSVNSGYQPFSYEYCKPILIDENLLKIIDDIMSHAPTEKNFLNDHFWSDNKRTLLLNYIMNFQIYEIFQFKHYERCLIRYNNNLCELDFSGTTEEPKLKKYNPNDLALQLKEVYFNNNGALENDNKYCLNIRFNKIKKAKKPNKELIKTYLAYFTMNNTTVLDKLSLDFVNSALHFGYSHKNTIILGDYDKFHKWRMIFGIDNIASLGLITLYPFFIQLRVEVIINKSDEEVKEIISKCAAETTSDRFCHRYFLVNRNVTLPNGTAQKVNYIDFPYGGEFYNYEPLSDVDRLEIVKLLIIHGWHLLNSAETPKMPKAKSSEENVLFKHLINTDETRIPLNVLHKIYNHFIDSKITDTELQKELVKKGFAYTTRAIRTDDKLYLQTLSKEANELYCELEIRDTAKQKAISCKLDPEFWNEISPERKKATEDKNAAEFNEYLKELSEKYAKFFVEEEPEKPVNNDPYAGFLPPEKIPDKDLQ